MVLCTVIFVSREATSMIAMWIGSLSRRVSSNVLREIKIFHTNLIMSERVKNGPEILQGCMNECQEKAASIWSCLV